MWIYTNTETRNMTKFKEAEHDSAFMAKCLFLDNMQVAIFCFFYLAQLVTLCACVLS